MAAAATLVFAAGDLVAAAEVSAFPNPSDPRMAVLVFFGVVFFGVEEDGAGAGAATFGGRDGAGGETEDGGVGGAVASAATADPKSLAGEALGLGETIPVFGGSSLLAGKRETNSSLAPAFAIDVWLKSLGRLSPSLWMFSLVAFSAFIMGGSAGRTAPLSSETKCNTPADLIIGTADQDVRECCHAMLFAFVG